MTANSKNQQRESDLIERFHQLMLSKQPKVTVRESDPQSGGTSIDISYQNDSITITLAENSEDLDRNIY